MSRRHKRRHRHVGLRTRTKPGTSPGTLLVDPAAPKPVLRVMAYGPDRIVEREGISPEDAREYLGHWPVTWISVEGLGDATVIEELAEIFDIHRLALEDVVNVHQRAKVEQYDGLQFVVAQAASLDQDLHTEQVSFFLGADFVLSFHERSGEPAFELVRDRIRTSRARIREEKADYLLYSLLDAVVDGYFPVLEGYGERIETLEDEVIHKPDNEIIFRIREIRRNLLMLRRSTWPLREMLNSLLRDPIPHITDSTRVYLRDCYDHTVHVIDILEIYRELSSGLMEDYLSSINNQMNQVMKVLTIFAAIFIPLSFIASLYGMNFNTKRSPLNMPELDWYWGYPFVLLVMAATAGGLLWYFRRKGWLGGGAKTPRVDSRSTDAERREPTAPE
ncbi:MAG: magnesium/cobalt transporter CorA [Deltaproteobacteria bacterium]|nr:magnesium/cobalt transporter CorA [Deltaproteobacteria bacterium]